MASCTAESPDDTCKSCRDRPRICTSSESYNFQHSAHCAFGSLMGGTRVSECQERYIMITPMGQPGGPPQNSFLSTIPLSPSRTSFPLFPNILNRPHPLSLLPYIPFFSYRCRNPPFFCLNRSHTLVAESTPRLPIFALLFCIFFHLSLPRSLLFTICPSLNNQLIFR